MFLKNIGSFIIQFIWFYFFRLQFRFPQLCFCDPSYSVFGSSLVFSALWHLSTGINSTIENLFLLFSKWQNKQYILLEFACKMFLVQNNIFRQTSHGIKATHVENIPSLMNSRCNIAWFWSSIRYATRNNVVRIFVIAKFHIFVFSTTLENRISLVFIKKNLIYSDFFQNILFRIT